MEINPKKSMPTQLFACQTERNTKFLLLPSNSRRVDKVFTLRYPGLFMRTSCTAGRSKSGRKPKRMNKLFVSEPLGWLPLLRRKKS